MMFPFHHFPRLFFCSLLLGSTLIVSAETQAPTNKTVMQWMMQVIVPQSSILWEVDDPQSDEEWSRLILAAEEIIKAAQSMEKTALNENGANWSTQSDWYTYNSAMKTAANQAREAILEKNLDKLFAAGDDLYPPCEGCHLQFNPAVSGAN